RRAIGLRADEVAVEAEAPGEDGGGTGEAAAGQRAGHRAGVAGPARVHALDPRAVLQVLEHAGGEAAGDAERRGEPAGVQALEAPGGQRGSERPANGGRVPAARVEETGDRHAIPSTPVVIDTAGP